MKKLLGILSVTLALTSSGCTVETGLELPKDLIEETFTEDFDTFMSEGGSWNIICIVGLLTIEVVPIDGTNLVITHNAYIDDEFEYNIDLDTNTITMSNNPDAFDGYWNIRSGQIVKIEVPKDLLVSDVTLTTSNSTIEVNNLELNRLHVETSNAAVSVKYMTVTGDMTLESSNGKIVVSEIDSNGSNKLSVQTSNGKILVDNVYFAEYDFDTSNGRIELNNLNEEYQDGVEIRIHTSNADVVLKEVYVNLFNLETSNGDVEYHNTDTTYMPETLEIDTSNGTIDKNVR